MAAYKKVYLKDIAAKAGVSPALVSFVLNGKGRALRVNENTAAMVCKVAEEMKYHPNVLARSLRSGKSRSIGVILSDISNPFFANIARGIEDAAAKIGYRVFFASSDENVIKMDVLVPSLLNSGVDGLIIVPCEGSENSIRSLIEDSVPVVLFDRPFRGISVSSVALNNYGATQMAVEHLKNQGYKKIGMLAYGVDLPHMHDRIQGYRDGLLKSGLKFECVMSVADDDTRKNVNKAMGKMMNVGADAVLCATNNLSMACLYYLNDNKILIPEDLGFVGFDGTESFDLFYTPLDYVKQPVTMLSQKVVEIIVELIENGSNSVQCIQIDGELVVRNRQ